MTSKPPGKEDDGGGVCIHVCVLETAETKHIEESGLMTVAQPGQLIYFDI